MLMRELTGVRDVDVDDDVAFVFVAGDGAEEPLEDIVFRR